MAGPSGKKQSAKTQLGGTEGGRFESVAVDDRIRHRPIYFITEDDRSGALRKYSPPFKQSTGWESLHVMGWVKTHYLNKLPGNRFEWTKNYYVNAEGIIHQNGMLYFVSKLVKKLFLLDLDNMTYSVEYTNKGVSKDEGEFHSQPDQIASGDDGYMCFTEDGSSSSGVYCRRSNSSENHITIFEPDPLSSKETRLQVLPSAQTERFYACYHDWGCNRNARTSQQTCGCFMEFWRKDGLAFNAATMNLKQHL
eukprot:g7388.t1 g7388   contig24:505229-506381(+)